MDRGTYEWSAYNKDIHEVPVPLTTPSKLKTHPDVHGYKHKVRICACGDLVRGKDNLFGYSPTCDRFYILFVFIRTTLLGYTLQHIDAINAYTHAPAPQPRMMYKPPHGIVPSDPDKPLLHALRAIYGDVESGRAYYLFWVYILEVYLNYQRVYKFGCLMMKMTDQGLILISTIVVDSAISAPNDTITQQVVQEIKQHIHIECKKLDFFLGININYDLENRILKMDQHELIEEAARKFGVNLEGKIPLSPLPEQAKITCDDCPENVNPTDATSMRSMIGVLLYVSITRPTISYAVMKLATVQDKPSRLHLKYAPRMFKYLLNTKMLPLVFSAKPYPLPDGTIQAADQPIILADSSYGDGGKAEKHRSTGGYNVLLGGAAWVTKSNTPKIIADSSPKAELQQLYGATKQVMAIHNLFNKIKQPLSEPIGIKQDNNTVISVFSVSSNNKNSRHWETKYFWIEQVME
mmetsp:Transcript_23401/g.58728  ORF Transcript_23401/g.58728 Transcript_23401/m.58728 type:complete len:464 (+) Transcript_23401:842-2233(+)